MNQSNFPQANWIPISQIASEMNVSTCTLRRWVRNGIWPAWDKVGGSKKLGYNRVTYAKLLNMSPELVVINSSSEDINSLKV